MSGAAAPARVRVKICGVTRPQDALAAERAGADAVGMVFASTSRRRVDPLAAAEIVAALGAFVTTVGVFRDAPLGEVIETVQRLRLDAAQLHGSEGPEFAAAVGRHVKVIRAVPHTAAPEPSMLLGYPANAFLLDAPAAGSGLPFDWRTVAAWHSHPRLVLAGGLTPGNVGAAVAALRPYAVDVATGVEREPGVKDHQLIQRFIDAVRAAEASGAAGASAAAEAPGAALEAGA